MNIDRGIVNRALAKAGQEPITDKQVEDNSTVWRAIKEFYLATILETLSNTEWTSQKRRARLEPMEEENLTRYIYGYKLPEDCAKPVELQNNREFSVEGNYLYTDQNDAILMYITNGKTSEYVVANPQPTSETFTEGEFYTLQEDGIYVKALLYEEGVTYYHISKDDYPGYKDFKPDPMLSEYIETRLASKIVLKITGETRTYQLLYNEAMIMENRAVKSSSAQSHSKENGNEWWTDTIGGLN